jgi:hypothetical protein
MADLVVLPVLSTYGELEWGKEVLPATEAQALIPTAFWRFRRPNPGRDDLIVRTVRAFSGHFPWLVSSYPESAPEHLRNWFLIPEPLREYHQETGSPVLEASRDALSRQSPQIARMAFEDYPRIAQALAAAGARPPRRARRRG